MKMIVAVALALVAIVSAAPVEEQIQIVRSEYELTPDGAFNQAFETGNGIVQESKGSLKVVNDEDNKPQNVLVITGSYSYPGENGDTVKITYEADENGYRAFGPSIPQVAST